MTWLIVLAAWLGINLAGVVCARRLFRPPPPRPLMPHQERSQR
jgi:hypothetical protein